MKESKKVITRRDFIRGTAYLPLAVAMGLRMEAQEEITPLEKTNVILVRDAEAIDAQGRINAKVIQRMLDDGVTILLGKEDPVESWKLLVKPTDVVGIKSNAWGPIPTPKEIEQAIKQRVMDAGVPEENIGIDDRGVLRNKIFLNSTALINTRPIRTHHWSGIGGLIKNYIPFVPNPPAYHDNSCANLAAIWNLPIVKGKARLNVLIMLRPLFYGIGPHHFDSTYMWSYKGILVGTDPVAIDAVGLRILQAKRLDYFGEDRPFRPPVTYITRADTKYKLGTSDLRRINLVKLGWKDGILI